MKLVRLACLGALALAAAPALSADIDTTGSDSGTIFAFGAPDTATYGQTFTVDAGDTQLNTFSLFLRNRFDGAGTLDLRGYLATWDGTKAGTLLYSSDTRTMPQSAALTQFSFAPAVAVTAGQQYVAFLSVSDLFAQDISRFGMPYGGNSIAGQFVFLNNGTDFGSLFSSPWNQAFVGQNDVFFTADFGQSGTVPEPATWAMMIGGIGLTGAGLRRRARVRTAVRFA